jgi:tetratricopeptide (TPR) repeat protein
VLFVRKKLVTLMLLLNLSSGAAYCEEQSASGKAAKLFFDGKYSEALPLFKDVVAREPGNERARYYLAMTYLKLDQKDAAKDQFQYIVNLKKDSQESKYSAQMLASLSTASAASKPTAQTAQASTAVSASPTWNVPRIDELRYWHQIDSVVSQGERHSALMLKPKYRQELLSGPNKLSSIMSNYSDGDRAIEERWVAAHQAAMQSFRQQPDLPVKVAGYNPNQFVGYRCGGAGRIMDQDGICYKVFFEFDDAVRDLTPELYLQFAKELAKAGFNGDSKIGMGPGYTKFYYNNIIVHAPDPETARIAEQVGLHLFGSRLVHYAHGVDVLRPTPQDWHEFLATSSDLSRLSQRALLYVTN